MVTFEFIGDKTFQEIIERDYQELEICLKNNAIKSVLVLSGSIIEAMLIEYFQQFTPNGYTINQFNLMSLKDLIDLAEKENVLSNKEKNLADVIKDYRNLIHPGKEIRKAEKFNQDTAQIAVTLVNMILKAVQDKYSNAYGYTSKEILNKIINDYSFRTLYEKVILKLNQTERVKLFNELVKLDMSNKAIWPCFTMIPTIEYSLMEFHYSKPFLLGLKPLVPTSIVDTYLKQLIKEIESGDVEKALSLYNLFHEEIYLLPDDEIETIVVYMFSMFSNIFQMVNDLVEEKTFSTIGKYISGVNTKKALEDFTKFCFNNFTNEDSMAKQFDLFEQVFNSLKESDKSDLQVYMNKLVSSSSKLTENQKLAFISPAITRGIMGID